MLTIEEIQKAFEICKPENYKLFSDYIRWESPDNSGFIETPFCLLSQSSTYGDLLTRCIEGVNRQFLMKGIGYHFFQSGAGITLLNEKLILNSKDDEVMTAWIEDYPTIDQLKEAVIKYLIGVMK